MAGYRIWVRSLMGYYFSLLDEKVYQEQEDAEFAVRYQRGTYPDLEFRVVPDSVTNFLEIY